MMNDVIDIYHSLKKFFKDDFQIDLNVSNQDSIVGTYKGYLFKLTYKKYSYLILSISKEGEYVFVDFIEAIIKIINRMPICEYDLENKYKIMKTFEWNMVYPKKRIEIILNDMAWEEHSCQNVIVY